MDDKNLKDIRECLELLNAIEIIEYHNKNWLPNWATKNPKLLSAEKLNLLRRSLDIIGGSGKQVHT
jgi:hypothetical protein